jgi:hypothetical protein
VNDSVEARRQRLAETIAWCSLQKLINKPIESEEIKQRRALGERAANHAFAAHQLESASLFKWVNRKKVKSMQEEALRMHREARLDEIRPLAAQLRTPALKPSMDFEEAKSTEQRIAVVEGVCAARRGMLSRAGQELGSGDIKLAGGRLLLYSQHDIDQSAAAGYPSKGLFNPKCAPPWDTWVCYMGEYVVSYIPRVLCGLAQDGMDVDPMNCIRWANDALIAQAFGPALETSGNE